jgi:outer membrane protein OmpA-like peptidoglycan-associated protein
MKKSFLYIVVLLAILQSTVVAQTAATRRAVIYFRNAEKEFNDQRYMYAIPFYKTSLKNPGQNDSLTYLHIAESYWYVRNYDSALYYYQQFEKRFASLFSTRQRIAELLANKKQYREASVIYRQLLQELPARNTSLLSERMEGFTDTKPFLRDSLDYNIRLLKLNTTQQDFSPQYFQRGLVFVSNRYTSKTAEKEFGWDGLPFAGIYWVKDTTDLYVIDTVGGYTSRTYNNSIKANDDYTSQTSNDNDIIVVSGLRTGYNGMIHRLDKFSNELNSKYNYGPLCFNKAGDKVYFTRNNLLSEKGRFNLEICVATLENGSWGKIRVMPFVDKQFDFFHPALSGDENRLYFCSNKPGGLGGSDIYYVSLASEYDMSVAIGLDNKINTAGNELFPTVIEDSLFFSSDGLAGLGGLDIYKTYAERGFWKKPINLGYPVNSNYDDFGIIYNNARNKGFFASNRLGSDDIFVFEKKEFQVQLEGTVLSRKTQRRLDSVTVIIFSSDSEKVWTDTVITDFTGNYHFPVRAGRAYTLHFSRNGYLADSMQVKNSGTETKLTLPPMLLTPVAAVLPPDEADRDKDTVPDTKDKCPDVKGPQSNFGCPDIQAEIDALAKMIFFKTASAELTAAALKPLNAVTAYLSKYPNLTLYIEGHTDNRAPAAYNKDLSQRRAKSVKEFFVKKGFAAERFTTAGFGLERPIADNKTEEGRAMNRRVAIQATFH